MKLTARQQEMIQSVRNSGGKLVGNWDARILNTAQSLERKGLVKVAIKGSGFAQMATELHVELV